MRKISIMLSVCAALSVQYFNAQVTPIGNEKYGRIFDVTYDAQVQDRVYAVTLNNHILVSNDDGKTWDIFYSRPATEAAAFTQLKLSENGESLSFVSQRTASSQEKIVVLDIATKTVKKEYTLPNDDKGAWVTNYDLLDGDTNTLLVDTNWKVGFDNEDKTFVTYDGGQNWKELYYNVDNNFVFISKVAFDPTNSDKIFLLRDVGYEDSYGGVWISSDKGNTWTKSLDGVVLSAIAFNPENHNDIFMGTGIDFLTTEKVYHSTDGGENWEDAGISWGQGSYTLNNITAINFNPKNPKHIVVLEEDEVATSFDGGQTWDNVQYENGSVDSYYFGLKTSFNPFNDQELMVSANYKPLVSTDGGKTFDKQIQSPYFQSTGNATAYVEQGTEKHLYYGVQFGIVHQDLNTNIEEENGVQGLDYFAASLPSYYFDKNNIGHVFTVKSGFIGPALQMSKDHGATYSQISDLSWGASILSINAAPGSDMVWGSFVEDDGSGTPLNVVRKINTANLDNPTVDVVVMPSTEFVSKFIFPNTGEMIAAADHNIYKTTNDGSTWTKLNQTAFSEFIFDIQQSPWNASEYSIATSGGVYVSTDNGTTWTKQSNEIVKNIYYSKTHKGGLVAVNRPDVNSGFGVYYTSNSGAEWKKIDSQDLDDVSASSYDVAFNGDQALLYIGSDDLGLVTYNLTFEDLGTNDSPISKNKLSVYPNPTSDVINIKTDKKINNAVIYDASGKVVKTATKNLISVSDLQNGVYFVVVNLADQTAFSTKFIKK